LKHGIKKFRAKQIFEWLHRGVQTFEEMTNLPKELRKQLSEFAYIAEVSVYKMLVSKTDKTVKFVFRLYDGSLIETVVMKYKHGYSVCVSSQVGCRMGCAFCQSTKGGLVRNLLPGEILGQILTAQHKLGIRISNIVMMGIGEPLDNFDNTVKFLKLVNHPDGINIGYRHISLSTCGLADNIRRLAEVNLPITLSISLHDAFDDKRSTMMPVNKKYPIDKLLRACRYYQSVTGRRIVFEYSLMDGVNDSTADAKRLFDILSGIMYHINLIPVNKIEDGIFYPPDTDKIKKFSDTLISMGASCTVRRTLGADISASCGQLRSKYERERRNCVDNFRLQ
jgi:23S rRNA (adenine2503-C2)-methyltransferase